MLIPTKYISMKKNVSNLLFTALLLVVIQNVSAQWAGSTSSTANALTYRGGSLALGTTSLIGTYGSNDRVFQVTGQSSTGGAFLLLGSATGGNNFTIAYTPSLSSVGIHSASYPLAFNIGGSERMRLQTNGNVGIGTATANHKLDVNGSINATGILLNGSPIKETQWATSGTNINYNAAGMVSIGTTTTPAGYKLAVGGRIVAEEIVVKLQANWPDYVFENDYKMPSLEELQLFIAEHKHLPGVPSAKEIQENGVSVGEMNAILLKKVEELTLYLLEQNKLIQKQNERIVALEKAGSK